jgi:hypothetical protein
MRGRASEIEPEVGTYGDRGIETTICGNKGRGGERERKGEICRENEKPGLRFHILKRFRTCRDPRYSNLKLIERCS